MRTFITLACFMLLSIITNAADLVAYPGGITYVSPGSYGVIEYKGGSHVVFENGNFVVNNNNTNEKDVTIIIKSTAKVNFNGSFNSAGGLKIKVETGADVKFSNIELQNGDNVLEIYESTSAQVIQLLDGTSVIKIVGCGVTFTTNGHASLNSGKYHSVELVNGGQWIANGGMDYNIANQFFGKGFVRVNGNFNLNKHFTDAETNEIMVCVKAHLQDWQYTNYLDNVKLECTYICDPMPVTIESFEGRKEGNVTQLNWSTSEETNSDRFEVERSLTGKDWNVIATIKSHTESYSLKTYKFTDEHPLSGNNLYRLKMIDLDHTFAYSTMISIAHDIQLTEAPSVYPNPCTGTVLIKNLERLTNLTITSITGTEVYNGIPRVGLEGILAGLYIVKFTDKSGITTTQKLIVQ